MSENQIPEDLRQFILSACATVPHLEALLLLRREAPRTWNTADIARNLYIDERTAAVVLRDLTSIGLAVADDTTAAYHYAPSSDGNAQLVDRLADLYAHALVAVTNLIHGRSAQLFADAFKFRKE